MSGINKVILVGRLGADPEKKQTQTGQTVTRLNLATSESWVNREGERQEKTEWHRIVIWGKLAETCAQHLSKGRQVYIEGRLQTRSWETEKGEKRFSTEVVANQVLFLAAGAPKTTETKTPNESYSTEETFDSNTSTKEADLPF